MKSYNEELTLEKLLPMLLGIPLNSYQQQWLEDMKTNNLVVPLIGPRACGRTSFALCFIAIKTVLESNKLTLIMCQHHKNIPYIQDTIKLYIDKMFIHLMSNYNTGFCYSRFTTNEIMLDNQSKIIINEIQKNASCGRKLDILFLDSQNPENQTLYTDVEFMSTMYAAMKYSNESKFLISVTD